MATGRASGERRHTGDSSAVTVRVRLFAALHRFVPAAAEGPLERSMPAGSTVADLLSALGIPDEVDATVAMDGELAERVDALRDGAEIMVLSPMEGG
jgi:sulfur carrier protein ThiS